MHLTRARASLTYQWICLAWQCPLWSQVSSKSKASTTPLSSLWITLASSHQTQVRFTVAALFSSLIFRWISSSARVLTPRVWTSSSVQLRTNERGSPRARGRLTLIHTRPHPLEDCSIGGAICVRVWVSYVACVVCELQRIKNNNNMTMMMKNC